jgi:IclR family transcriptional regulator, acetate operon repressor
MARGFQATRIRPASTVGSVQRALRVLETVASHPGGLTPKAVARRLGLALSTTYNLLNTLAAEGYVVRLEGGRGYVLGDQVWVLSRGHQAPGPTRPRDLEAPCSR